MEKYTINGASLSIIVYFSIRGTLVTPPGKSTTDEEIHDKRRVSFHHRIFLDPGYSCHSPGTGRSGKVGRERVPLMEKYTISNTLLPIIVHFLIRGTRRHFPGADRPGQVGRERVPLMEKYTISNALLPTIVYFLIRGTLRHSPGAGRSGQVGR